MTGPITIMGRDIIESTGRDETGALAELGIPFTPLNDGTYDVAIANMTFDVDLDFVLRHGLLDAQISEAHYKGTPEYLRYYNEGRDAFLSGLDERNPHDTGTIADPDYWTRSIHHKRYPWYDGYRETQAAAMEAKYSLKAMQEEVRAVVTKHGLTVEDCDEYPGSYSSARTPEGFIVKLT